MDTTLQIKLQVSDAETLKQITNVLETMLPFMGDNVEIVRHDDEIHTFDPLYLEDEIQYMAMSVISDCVDCHLYPTGTRKTKTSIRQSYARLEGMAALYAYLTGQTLSALNVNSALVKFADSKTTERVKTAIKRVEAL